MSRTLAGIIAASALALLAAPAMAGPAATSTIADTAAASVDDSKMAITPPPANTDAPKLTFSLTPYLFMSAIRVNVKGGPTGTGDYTANASFTDVLSHIKFVFMSGGEVGYGRFGVLGDLIYADIQVNAQPRNPILDFISAKSITKELLTTVEGRYRLVDQPGIQLDAMAGVRIADIQQNVDIFLPNRTLSGQAGRTPVIPVIGMRARVPINRYWKVLAYADGGLVNGASTWQAYGGFSYMVSRRWDLALGYRYFDLEYSNAPRHVGIAMYGPMFSGTYRF